MSGGFGVVARGISSDKTVALYRAGFYWEVNRPNSDEQFVVSVSRGGQWGKDLNRAENSGQFVLRQSGLWHRSRHNMSGRHTYFHLQDWSPSHKLPHTLQDKNMSYQGSAAALGTLSTLDTLSILGTLNTLSSLTKQSVTNSVFWPPELTHRTPTEFSCPFQWPSQQHNPATSCICDSDFTLDTTGTMLTHWGRVTQICVFTLQLCKTDDANLCL